MPSAGMRRTTRVFGVVKGVDGARVLRSGRRLWPESGVSKFRKGNDRDEWLSLIDSKGSGNGLSGGIKSKQFGFTKNVNSAEIAVVETRDAEFEMPETKTEESSDRNDVDAMYGIVYNRKRKRESVVGLEASASGKKYGIHFSRRQKRNTGGCGCDEGEVLQGFRGLAVVLKPPCENSTVVAFLCSVLLYMKRVGIRLSALSKFVVSEPFCGVFAQHGIHFSRESPSTFIAGTCKLFGVRQFTPIFSVDFSAAPLCFMYMHRRILLQHCFVLSSPVNNSTDVHINDDLIIEEGFKLKGSDHSVLPSEGKTAGEVEVPGNRLVLHLSVRGPKVDNRSTQHRYILNSRGIRKRRSSLRSRRRGRNPSQAGVRKCNGALASDLVSATKNGFPFSSIVSGEKVRRSLRNRPAASTSELSATTAQSSQDTDTYSCSTNLLIVQSDKCFRDEGANVMLETLDSGEWSLVVKKGGLTRYTHKAQEAMKPCFSNRFTHAVVWPGDYGWKLEFPNRDDWLKFKDLYKECSDRNKQVISPKTPSVKIIPVPGVHEVHDYGEGNLITFSRPDSYIIVNGDEVSRAMSRKTATYDMDYEDEEWLTKFNEDNFKIDCHELISEETFELLIDAFEKAFYCNPHDFSNEKPDPNICLDVAKRDVVEAVYEYWMKKRKQRRQALVRVFQGQQTRKAPLVPRPALRKKRSFKRQTNHLGRGKQPKILQALAAQTEALEERDALRKVEEAQASANRIMELAIAKRQRAQSLMENADLAAYKATMALRIAEAAQVAESPDVAAAHFLD